MAWYQAYEQIKPYVVRIETVDNFGTGFLFAYNKTNSVAALATASHVIEDAADWNQPIKLWHPDSNETLYLEKKDRVAWLDRVHDAATILITAGSIKFPKTVLPLLAADKTKKTGVEIGWVGFPHLARTNICFFSGRVSAYLGNVESYLIDGVAINGVSGGPVFSELQDGKPQLIGVVSAYMANRRAGETLPGLLQARDLAAFHEHIQKIKSFDEAKDKEQEAQKKTDAASGHPKIADVPADRPSKQEPPTPATPDGQ
jgi:hypothetical protein